MKKRLLMFVLSIGFLLFAAGAVTAQVDPIQAADRNPINFFHISSINGDLEPPSASTEQTASLVLDIDLDGINDFVIGIRQPPGPSLVWYRRHVSGWDRYLIELDPLNIEAGGAFADIDGDGDLDIVMGGDYQSNEVWWWENPYPNYDPNVPWARHTIKRSGQPKHHDQMFGDFDGDGQLELVFWNQGARTLYLARIPDDPKSTDEWPLTAIYSWDGGDEHEGLAQADIDGDGRMDIIGGGRWFKHEGGDTFTPQIIDDAYRFSRAAAGQIKAGGRPEVVFVVGDGVGRMAWYEWNGAGWVGHDLGEIDHGHSLDLIDFNNDGHLDIFVAEMRLNGGNEDSGMWIYFGDGQGAFTRVTAASGFGNHESRVADLDGDGDLDILGKPYNWETPRIDIWLNESDAMPPQPFERWQRHSIDDERPWRAVFIYPADINGDGLLDIVTGGWWYRNPGQPGGVWERMTIGDPLNNVAAVYDFDGDGYVDILGTAGKGSDPNSTFVWARNDGNGDFTIYDNIQPGTGDFLQGVAVERFESEQLGIALSWHDSPAGVQLLRVPANPMNETWQILTLSDVSQNEALSAGDIDGDGRIDLLLGTIWLRNTPTGWVSHPIAATDAVPDRNRLVDINQDSRLDAVVGFEAISTPGKLVWYSQGSDPLGLWTEHIIADPPIVGPMSLDVGDIDGDGDLDVVVGEHNLDRPEDAALYWFENADGLGTLWNRHLIYMGDEHHDGAILADMDGDGDLDVISIGWSHNRVVLYENRANSAPSDPGLTDRDSPPGPDGICGPENIQALYTFQYEEGEIIRDHSGIQPALDLYFSGPGPRWLEGDGMLTAGPGMIWSEAPVTRLVQAVKAANELTVEAWVRPVDLDQKGPARIVTISQDVDNRNFTLGQGLWDDLPSTLYDVRLRTSTSDANGMPSLSSAAGTLTLQRVQVAFTHSADGISRLYIDGALAAEAVQTGGLQNWNDSYILRLADEIGGTRPWWGEYHGLVFYNCAMDAEQIMQHYQAGPPRVLQPAQEAPEVDDNSNASEAVPAAQDPRNSEIPEAVQGEEQAAQGFLWSREMILQAAFAGFVFFLVILLVLFVRKQNR
jgi:hypothetical protein